MDWVEASGKSVDVAVEAAMAELGIESRDGALIEVLQEPKAGFLGIGAQEAIVKVSPKPRDRRRRRRRGRGKDGERSEQAATSSRDSESRGQSRDKQGGGRSRGRQERRQDSPQPQGRGGRRDGDGADEDSKRQGDRRRKQPARSADGRSADDGRRGMRTDKTDENGGRRGRGASGDGRPSGDDGGSKELSIQEQSEVAVEFIEGLLAAYGLEGSVETEIDDDILKITVEGEQTEALVGAKGAVMQAVLEITRTVVQRKTFGAPRMRLDIAGYNERRREALTIYAGKLAERVIADGGEVMLEPMNAADRKVVHDAIGAIDGVRSFSEGEDPDRSVVISAE